MIPLSAVAGALCVLATAWGMFHLGRLAKALDAGPRRRRRVIAGGLRAFAIWEFSVGFVIISLDLAGGIANAIGVWGAGVMLLAARWVVLHQSLVRVRFSA